MNENGYFCDWFCREIWGKGLKSEFNVLWYNIVELV